MPRFTYRRGSYAYLTVSLLGASESPPWIRVTPPASAAAAATVITMSDVRSMFISLLNRRGLAMSVVLNGGGRPWVPVARTTRDDGRFRRVHDIAPRNLSHR